MRPTAASKRAHLRAAGLGQAADQVGEVHGLDRRDRHQVPAARGAARLAAHRLAARLRLGDRRVDHGGHDGAGRAQEAEQRAPPLGGRERDLPGLPEDLEAHPARGFLRRLRALCGHRRSSGPTVLRRA
jgi:hypothetical protein